MAGNQTFTMLPSDSRKLTSDEYEANSRIIQRLASSGIISASDLTSDQKDQIFALVGLDYRAENKDKIVNVELTPAKSELEYNEMALFIGHEVLRKISPVPTDKLKDTRVTITFE